VTAAVDATIDAEGAALAAAAVDELADRRGLFPGAPRRRSARKPDQIYDVARE
jgi:hypothetical protein